MNLYRNWPHANAKNDKFVKIKEDMFSHLTKVAFFDPFDWFFCGKHYQNPSHKLRKTLCKGIFYGSLEILGGPRHEVWVKADPGLLLPSAFFTHIARNWSWR